MAGVDDLVPPTARPRGYDVIAVGNATTDYVLSLPRPLLSGQKLVALSMLVATGGEAVNAAITMAALGLDVNFVGRFGSDEAGKEQAETLRRAGCTLEGSQVMDGVAHHFAAVLVGRDSGERSIVTSKADELTPSANQLTPSLMAKTAAFFSDGRETDITVRGARMGREHGARVFLDAESHDILAAVLEDVDELIVPAHVVTGYTNTADVEEATVKMACLGPHVVVATMGERGSVACADSGKSWFRHAPSVRAVDTTGAGDGFHAGYMAGRLRGMSVSQAMSLASTVAARVCERPGPRVPAVCLEDLRFRRRSRREGRR